MKKFTFLFFLMNTMYSYAQLNLSLIGQKSYTYETSSIWGHTDQLGNEYALVGTKKGISIVDITNTPSLQEVYKKEDEPMSIWREVKVWNNHAYVTTEAGGGLLIIDMSTLPANTNLTTSHYTGVNYPFSKAHTLFIDENGILYLFGSNFGNGGAIMYDLKPNPKNPVELGYFDGFYIHDGFVRGDTLWASAIYDGFLGVVNVSNKSNPQLKATFSTPNNFTHNSWPSDDNKYLFTTDEVSNAYVASYDVSNLSNIDELDRFQSGPGLNIIPHNTHYLNGYLVTAYYTSGIVIIDAAKPDNLAEVANYDGSLYTGSGFHGVWGVYPYFSSQKIIASDIEGGLFVWQPNYQRASYIEGNIVDSLCGGIHNAKIEILGDSNSVNFSKLDGSFKAGTYLSGSQTIRVTIQGYPPKIINNVVLTQGQVVNLNIILKGNTSDVVGTITSPNLTPLQDVLVNFKNDIKNYDFTTDNNGTFESCNIVKGTYDITLGKWGYKTICLKDQEINNDQINLNFSLEKEYYDDFSFPLGWTVINTASKGNWVRDIPKGTQIDTTWYNPPTDVDDDCNQYAFVTGNSYSATWVSAAELDGKTTLISPSFDVSLSPNPSINLSYWFQGNKGVEGSEHDYLKFYVTNNLDTVLLDSIGINQVEAKWKQKEYGLSKINKSNPLKFIVVASDEGISTTLEAGIDLFFVNDSTASSIDETFADKINASFYPNPFDNTIKVNYDMRNSFGKNTITIFDITGKIINQEIIQEKGIIEIGANLNSGIYFAELKNNKNRKVFKINKL